MKKKDLKIWVIHYTKLINRKQHLKPILDNFGFKYTFIEVYDKEDLNQIDLKKRVFVMGSKDIPNFPKPFALFNPTILEASNETVMDTEGCLSYPGLLIKVTRPSWIVGQWQNAQGETKEAKIQGYLAKCFQHEFDHLNGICFVDRVSRLKLQLALKKLNKLRKKLKND